jgi:hypothetical protein
MKPKEKNNSLEIETAFQLYNDDLYPDKLTSKLQIFKSSNLIFSF